MKLREDSSATANPRLCIQLLGGFRVERADVGQEVSEWPRRSAKTLIKMLAVHPVHALHLEQIMDVLWPDVDQEFALNNFGKALNAARWVLEPDLPPNQDSAYLRLADSMLILNTEHVAIDADRFEQLSMNAIRSGEIAAYESALSAYSGELLPEHRYESWCVERHSVLAEVHLQLLMGLAEAYERHGAYREAMSRLHEVLRLDPTHEDAHSQLTRLYGLTERSTRQFPTG